VLLLCRYVHNLAKDRRISCMARRSALQTNLASLTTCYLMLYRPRKKLEYCERRRETSGRRQLFRSVHVGLLCSATNTTALSLSTTQQAKRLSGLGVAGDRECKVLLDIGTDIKIVDDGQDDAVLIIVSRCRGSGLSSCGLLVRYRTDNGSLLKGYIYSSSVLGVRCGSF
jgi:hypothetical protein